MNKRKVFIAIHQLNVGGTQKALLSALNAIDYTENDVTLYVRKDRLDMLSLVNPAVSRIIINRDHTKYYRKPYAVWLYLLTKLRLLFGRNAGKTEEKLKRYVIKKQMQYENRHYLEDLPVYDIAISYIQGYTAKAVAEFVHADRRVMFYHDSTDSLHALHCEIIPAYDCICCVSKNAMNAISGFYPQYSAKFKYINNYVDAETVRLMADAFEPDIPHDKPVLCTCGRIAPVKGFDLAIDAADILKRQGVAFRWYFAGDGPDRAKTEQRIAELGLSDSIVITGMLDNPYPYIKRCDIYVQSSYEEAFSLAVLEALILYRPVVSTATAGGKSMLRDGENGLLAEISAPSLADRILFLFQNDALRDSMIERLKKSDYEIDKKRFRDAWKTLLEEG